MSIKLSGYIFDTDLSATETLMMLALADYADQGGKCWPSKETLARRSRVSKRTVDKYIKRLADGNWLRIESNGGRKSNNYYLNLKKIYHEGNLQPCKACTPQNTVKVQDLHPTPASHVAPELPIEDIKRPAAKKPLPASPPKDHTWFTAWWCFAYQQIVGKKYAYQKKDAGQIKQLLSLLGLIETTCRACAYLTLPEAQRFPRGSPTVGGLLHQINEVATQYDRDLEDRLINVGLLPDMEKIESLKHFQPWRQKI